MRACVNTHTPGELMDWEAIQVEAQKKLIKEAELLKDYKKKQDFLDALGVTQMALEAVSTHPAGVEGSFGDEVHAVHSRTCATQCTKLLIQHTHTHRP